MPTFVFYIFPKYEWNTNSFMKKMDRYLTTTKHKNKRIRHINRGIIVDAVVNSQGSLLLT